MKLIYTMLIVIETMEVCGSTCLSTSSNLTKRNYSYFAGSKSPNAITEQSDVRTRKGRKIDAMQYTRGSTRRLTPSGLANSIFSIELEEELETLLANNEYIEHLQKYATNTDEKTEVKKAKVKANVLTAVLILSTDSDEVID